MVLLLALASLDMKYVMSLTVDISVASSLAAIPKKALFNEIPLPPVEQHEMQFFGTNNV